MSYIPFVYKIWKHLEKRFNINDGACKNKLCKDVLAVKQTRAPTSEYYTENRYIWEELGAIVDLPGIANITDETLAFMNALDRQCEGEKPKNPSMSVVMSLTLSII